VAGHRAGVMKKMKIIFCSSHFQKRAREREGLIFTLILERGSVGKNEKKNTASSFYISATGSVLS